MRDKRFKTQPIFEIKTFENRIRLNFDHSLKKIDQSFKIMVQPYLAEIGTTKLNFERM